MLSELLKNASIVYAEAEPREKARIIEVIFSELTVTENTLEYKAKNGFAALQSRFVASCDLSTWLSELVTKKEEVALSTEELISALHA